MYCFNRFKAPSAVAWSSSAMLGSHRHSLQNFFSPPDRDSAPHKAGAPRRSPQPPRRPPSTSCCCDLAPLGTPANQNLTALVGSSASLAWAEWAQGSPAARLAAAAAAACLWHVRGVSVFVAWAVSALVPFVMFSWLESYRTHAWRSKWSGSGNCRQC